MHVLYNVAIITGKEDQRIDRGSWGHPSRRRRTGPRPSTTIPWPCTTWPVCSNNGWGNCRSRSFRRRFKGSSWKVRLWRTRGANPRPFSCAAACCRSNIQRLSPTFAGFLIRWPNSRPTTRWAFRTWPRCWRPISSRWTLRIWTPARRSWRRWFATPPKWASRRNPSMRRFASWPPVCRPRPRRIIWIIIASVRAKEGERRRRDEAGLFRGMHFYYTECPQLIGFLQTPPPILSTLTF